MLNTPTGMRFLEGNERLMFVHGAESLSKRLRKQMDEEQGLLPGCKAFMTGTGPFHKLNVAEQLVALRNACQRLLDSNRKYNPDLLTNGAVECVYSWLAHQICEEIVDDLTPSNKYRKLVYAAWMDFGDTKTTIGLNSLYPQWQQVLDKLAIRSVHEEKKGPFEPHLPPPSTRDHVEQAEEYFMTLVESQRLY